MKKLRKFATATCSAALAFMMTLNVFAISAGDLNSDPGPVSQTETASAELVSEVEHMRGANERHYTLSDGSYMAVSYPEQIHYQDEDGNWVEIDNRLEAVARENGKSIYKTKDGLFDVEFAQPDDASRNTVKIVSEGLELSWRLYTQPLPSAGSQLTEEEMTPSPIKNTATVSTPTVDYTAFSREENLLAAKKAASRMVYNDAFGDNRDVIYDISGNKIKEAIILDSFNGNTRYIAQITAPNLTAILNEDNSVSFTNAEGKILFVMQSPYMFDSAGSSSGEIAVTLREINSGYELSYIPNPAWLTSAERVYPVVIDPTVEVFNGSTTDIGCEDDTLEWDGISNESALDTNNIKLTVGNTNSTNYISFIDYDTPKLPNNCTLTDITQMFAVSGGGSTMPEIASLALVNEYTSGNITHENISQCYSTANIVTPTGRIISNYLVLEFSYSGASLNNYFSHDPTTGKIHSNGIMLVDPRLANPNQYPNIQGQYTKFCSSEYQDVALGALSYMVRPRLTVTYTRNEPPEAVYVVGNGGVSFGTGMNSWYFDKVEGAAAAPYSNTYGPYYIRFAATNGASIYLGHYNGVVGSVTMGSDELHKAPAESTSISGDTNEDYYWYLNDIGNNQYRIHYTATAVLGINESISYVTSTNIYNAFELQTVSESNDRQKWTLTVKNSSTSFIWPLAYEIADGRSTYQVTSLWGYRQLTEGGSINMHYGFDIRTNVNGDFTRNVLAVADGIVIDKGKDGNKYYVEVLHLSMTDGCGKYYMTRSIHLNSEPTIQIGQFVRQGDVIAVSGDSGATGRPHLHIQFTKVTATWSDSGWSTVESEDIKFNPSNEYNRNDTRRTIQNPNPIYFVERKDNFESNNVEAEFLYVNSNFIFNHTNNIAWATGSQYKQTT